jgi:hypothetical protein
MYKVFWILTLRQWHPHPTTGQVLQSSLTPDLISEEDTLNQGLFLTNPSHSCPKAGIDFSPKPYTYIIN